MTEQASEFLRQALKRQHDRVAELRAEVDKLKHGYTWAIFAAVTGWGGIIVICANFWS